MSARSLVSKSVAAGAAVMLTACGGAGNLASHSSSPSAPVSPTGSAPTSPGPSASPSAPALTGAYGVLVGSGGSGQYTVSLVGVDGKVVSSAQASSPTGVSCANAAAAVVPAAPVSTSDTRLYFMDAAGTVHFLGPNGDSGTATTVPAGTATRRSMFAVSPDDRRIAVVVDDFNLTGAATRLYVEDLNGGGNHIELFTESGAYTLWPIGWHGSNNLVVAKVPSCTQGGGPFCCGPLELHVIDPASATRRFTIGSSASCVIAGSPAPAGAVCENSPTFSQASVLTWTAGTVRSFSIPGPEFAYLSPDGSQVALVDNNGTSFTNVNASLSGVFVCGWIDDTHVLAGGDSQHQPRVADIANGGVVPVAAQGDCAGRLPGGL